MSKAAFSALIAGALTLFGLVVLPAVPAAAATTSFDLYAKVGSTTLPATGGVTLPVWGYTAGSGDPVSKPGGPTLTVNEGDTVVVTLHNGLAEPSSLLFQGQTMVPDLTGANAGADKTYTFTADHAGTYLYEAGLTGNAQHQVAMGLYGALVVLPAAANQAYADASTAYDKDAVLVLSEIDPALNTKANPAAFDMRKFAPKYFLINGETHPDIDPIATVPGDKVLLRYVNAGMTYHSMGVLGAHQAVIALDGSPLNFARRYVAETFGPGQTADAIVTVPATDRDTLLPIYDASMILHNSNTGAGGMLTFLDVAGTAGPTDTTGPATTNVAYTAGTLSATIDDTATGAADIAGAEYFIDAVGAAGSGTAMAGSGAGAQTVTAAPGVPNGQHILYVRGQDKNGNWGPLGSVLVINGDVVGPITTGGTLTPDLVNGAGTSGIAVHATADDTANGASNIAGAEFFIDATSPADGSGTAMSVNNATNVASVDGTIAATTLNALSEGTHIVTVHSRDGAGNWGPFIGLQLTVDKTAPVTSGVSAAVSPNNGTIALNASTPAVRVTALSLFDPFNLVQSPIAKGEVFIDTNPDLNPALNGTGIPLAATDGVYSTPEEAGYADIPLATVAQLSNGTHTIYVHAKDAAGNWGAAATTTLVIDKVKPTVSGLTFSPNPTLGAATVNLTGNAADNLTGIVAAEYFRGADPGFGNATPLSINGTGPYTLSTSIQTGNLSEGSYVFTVRVKDAAGNWSAGVSATLQVNGALVFSTFGNANPPGVAGTADDADIYRWNGSAFSRTVDVTTLPAALPAGANVDGLDYVDATHFYVSFSGTSTTVPGLGAVQDEDVLYYNNGTWSVWFDGTSHGLTAANQDIDAFSIVGSDLYFSTVGNTNPGTVTNGGPADDADIYRWNNGVSYTRIWDASANGFAAGANVDGLVFTDASHFYLSFSATNTAVPGQGNVQDEDVVHNNGGTWSVYFDGTSHGLTTDNLDVDAFDLP